MYTSTERIRTTSAGARNGGVTRRGVAFRGVALREPLRECREPSSEWRGDAPFLERREPSSPSLRDCMVSEQVSRPSGDSMA